MICYVDNTDSTEKWYYQFAAWLLITPGIRFLRRLESATFPFPLRAMSDLQYNLNANAYLYSSFSESNLPWKKTGCSQKAFQSRSYIFLQPVGSLPSCVQNPLQVSRTRVRNVEAVKSGTRAIDLTHSDAIPTINDPRLPTTRSPLHLTFASLLLWRSPFSEPGVL
jgi:hypothetical protein